MGATRRGGVLALLCDREAVARLSAALRQGVPGALAAGTELVHVERVGALREALAARPFAIVVVEPRDVDRVPTDETVRAIRAIHRGAAIVGYATRADLSSAILAFARAGVDELVLPTVDDNGLALRTALASAVRRSGADRLLAEVVALVPETFRPVVRFCLERAGEAPDVPTVARALGVSRQTLVERAHRAGLPTPRELITWCRLLVAAQLLAEWGGSVDQIAIELDFPSGNGLRNALRRYAGRSVNDVRAGGAGLVLGAFRDALAAARVSAGGPGADAQAEAAGQPV
jgi:AraC-like DNA-binding protein